MARTSLTVYPVSIDQTALTAKEADGTADGKMFTNTGDQFLFIRNSNATAARTVSAITTNETVGGAAYDTPKTITIPASGTTVFGPFEVAVWNTAANQVYIDFDAGNESDLKVVALSFTRAR